MRLKLKDLNDILDHATREVATQPARIKIDGQELSPRHKIALAYVSAVLNVIQDSREVDIYFDLQDNEPIGD